MKKTHSIKRDCVLTRGTIELDILLLFETESDLIYEITSGRFKSGIIIVNRKRQKYQMSDKK